MKTVNPSTPLRVNGERPSTTLRTALSERSESNGRSRTIKFITLGCKVNQYDTQSIRESFVNAGFEEIHNGKKAGIYVINTCTVTSNADRKSRYAIYQSHRQNPKARIIVTGCYTTLDSGEIAGIPGVTHIIKNQDKDKLLELLGGYNELNEYERHSATGIANFEGHTRAFIKIQDGCNNSCSYCKVPKVRGFSRSRPLNEITQEANRLIKNGFKEVVLCGVCLGSYGKDLLGKEGLIDVIGALEKIEGLLRIRLSSIEAADISDGLINKMAQSKKLCRHLHIPIQSGDNEILKKMNRNYSRQYYLKLIKKIKYTIPGVAITTDVIVGFPGEKEDNFQNTLDLIEEIMPLRVHIFPYSKRAGTAAGILKDEINPLIIKERVSRLGSVSKECALVYKKRFLNKISDILIETRPKEDNKYWEGYADNYIKVWVKSQKDLKNRLIRVRLKKIKRDCIEAYLPRTTESPICKDGDEWERFSRRVLPQSHACKGVVRGLP